MTLTLVGWARDRLQGRTTPIAESVDASADAIERRRFVVRLGGATLPNAAADVKPAPGTRPEFTPVADHYRIDINTSPPVVSEEAWRPR